MTKTTARCFLALFIAAALSAPLPSQAQTRAEQARAHIDRGAVFYNLQDWAAAAREYKEAYAADPKPEVLFMLGQAQRFGGECATAIGTYKAYSRSQGVTGTQQAAAEGLMHKCEAELADKQAKAVAAQPVAPAAPPHAAEGAPITAPSTAPAKETPVVPSPWYADVFGGVLFVGGLSLAGVGTGFLLAGNSAMSGAPSAASYAGYQDQSTGAKPKQTFGVAGVVVGSTVAMLGVIRYMVVAGRARPAEKAAAWLGIEPRVGPGGAAAALVGQF